MWTRAHRSHGTLAAFTLAFSVSLLAPSARAIDKAECVAAYEEGQNMKLEGSLREAKERLLVCVQDACPEVLSKDCNQWLSEVERNLPSVVIAAEAPDGSETSDVLVYVDGKVIATGLDGKAIAVNPGSHTFRFEHGDLPAVAKELMIRQGEKNRTVTVKFGGGTSQDDTGTGVDEPDRPIPITTYIFGGIGVAGLAGFTIFGLTGKSAVSDLDDCKPNCDQSDVDRAHTKLVVADVSLGIGLVSLGLATYFYFTRPPASGSEVTSSPWIDVTPVRNGAVAGVRGAF